MTPLQVRFSQAANKLGVSADDGITQAELADKLGVSLRTISRWLGRTEVVVPMTAVIAIEAMVNSKA